MEKLLAGSGEINKFPSIRLNHTEQLILDLISTHTQKSDFVCLSLVLKH